MTRTGTVKNGVVVLDGDLGLVDGTRVQIVPDARDMRGFTMDDIRAFGHPILVEGHPGEFDEFNRIIQEEREAEVRALEDLDRRRRT